MIISVTKAKANLSRCLAAAEKGDEVVIEQGGKQFEIRYRAPLPHVKPYTAEEIDQGLDARTVRLLNRAARASR